MYKYNNQWNIRFKLLQSVVVSRPIEGLALFIFFRKNKGEISMNQDELICLKADMHKRCRNFEYVTSLCKEHKTMNQDVQIILEDESNPAKKNEIKCHAINEDKHPHKTCAGEQKGN